MKRINTPNSTNRVIVVDAETTGLTEYCCDSYKPSEDEIVEIAALEVIDYKITGFEFHSYVNSSRAMNKIAQSIHKISDK